MGSDPAPPDPPQSHPEAPLNPAWTDELYDELRRLAAQHLRRERAAHTLQPTALAHEAWLRLSHTSNPEQRQGRAAFLAAAAVTIRRILVDHARSRGAAKRGGHWARVDVELTDTSPAEPVDMLWLDEALLALAALHPRQAQVVELRFFGGLSGDETAAALDVSPRTVDGDWRVARAWLAARLGQP
ncbi:MAG: RNA polymerase sigma-70 factor (ECF subfamily) [Pseudohongiellaceae bacterium]